MKRKFFSNHDQPRQISRFGDPKSYHFESASLLFSSYLFLRGTPFLLYGEEIGMSNISKNDIKEFNDQETINNYHILLKENHTKKEALKIVN